MRTDRVRLCPRCALRLPRIDTCPSCGERSLADLSLASARRKALRLLRRRRRPVAYRRLADVFERAVTGYVRYGVLSICAVGAVVVIAVVRSVAAGVFAALLLLVGQAAVIGLGFAAFGLLNLLWSAGVWLMDRGRQALGRDVETTPPLLPGPTPTPARDDRQRFVGRVRVAEPLESVLGHRSCAAFRLVGAGPRGAVDDAGGTTFEVVGEEGTARVVLGEAGFDIPVDDPPRAVRPDARLRAFLEERGIYPEKGPVRLAEGILRDGDEVEVLGRVDDRVEAEGYRGTRSVRIFRDAPDAPLVIKSR